MKEKGPPRSLGGPFNEHQRTALLWAGGAGTPYANVTTRSGRGRTSRRDVAHGSRPLSLKRRDSSRRSDDLDFQDGLQTSHTSKFIDRLWRPGKRRSTRPNVDDNRTRTQSRAGAPILPTLLRTRRIPAT